MHPVKISLIAVSVVLILFIAYRIYYWLQVKDLPKIESSPKQWDIKRLIDMHVRTSHNTYIGGSQNLTIASTSYIKKAMDLGARCLELDIGFKNGNPVVAHGSKNFFTTNSIPLTSALATVRDQAFKDADDPLLLTLELYHPDNLEYCDKIYDLLIATFGESLLRHVSNGTHESLKFLKFGSARNRILVMCRRWNSDSKLSTIFELWSDWDNMGTGDPNAEKQQIADKFHRIFPEELYTSASVNIDGVKYMNRGFNSVGMNFAGYDKRLMNYLNEFGNHGYKPF